MLGYRGTGYFERNRVLGIVRRRVAVVHPLALRPGREEGEKTVGLEKSGGGRGLFEIVLLVDTGYFELALRTQHVVHLFLRTLFGGLGHGRVGFAQRQIDVVAVIGISFHYDARGGRLLKLDKVLGKQVGFGGERAFWGGVLFVAARTYVADLVV